MVVRHHGSRPLWAAGWGALTPQAKQARVLALFSGPTARRRESRGRADDQGGDRDTRGARPAPAAAGRLRSPSTGQTGLPRASHPEITFILRSQGTKKEKKSTVGCFRRVSNYNSFKISCVLRLTCRLFRSFTEVAAVGPGDGCRVSWAPWVPTRVCAVTVPEGRESHCLGDRAGQEEREEQPQNAHWRPGRPRRLGAGHSGAVCGALSVPLGLEGGDWRPLTQLQRQGPVRTAEAFLRHACPLPYPELVMLPPAPNSGQQLRQEGEGWPDGSPRPAPASLCPGCAVSRLRLPPPALGRARAPPRLVRALGREGGRRMQLARALRLVIDGPIRAGLRRRCAGSFSLCLQWS